MTDKINIGGKAFSADEIATLAKAGVLNIGQKNDPASTTLPAGQLHGPNQSGWGFGPLAYPGVRPQMLSAMTRPWSLVSVLPLMKSDVDTEKIDIHTGVTTEGGTNATGWCGDPPANGAFKKCGLEFTWGDYYIKDDLVAVAEIGMRRDRADVPRAILNAASPEGAGNPFIPEGVWRLNDTFSQLAYQQYLVGVAAERDICHVAIQGNSALASTATQHGWIQEFTGLDSLIATGYDDRITSTTCPVVDPAVISFNALVTGTDANSRAISDVLRGLMMALKQRGTRAGLNGVTWAAVMRYELFYNLVQTIACNMWTTFCTSSTNGAQQQSARDIEGLRLEMLGGNFLYYDGMRLPVVFDECVPQDTLGNQYYKSDIYIIPLDWAGMPLTYWQYFDMENQYSMEYGNKLGKALERLNNGLWLVGQRDTGLCFEHHYQMKLRLVLEAPFLSARIDDVWYYFREPIHNAIPGESQYYDGGDSYIQPQYLTV